MMDTKEAAQRIINLTANFDQFMATLDQILRRAADALGPTATFRQRQEARDAINAYLARNSQDNGSSAKQDAGGGDRSEP